MTGGTTWGRPSRGLGGSRGLLLAAALAAPAALTALAVPASQAAAQAGEEGAYTRAMAGSARATELARAGRLEDAVTLLEGVLDECTGTPDRPRAPGATPESVRDCRRVALYSLGWVHQSVAETRPAQRADLLRRASAFFRDVLEENPDYEAARRGLALTYRKLGAREEQEDDLRRLASEDPTGRYTLMLGDYYRDARRIQAAADAYRRAAEAAPLDEEPRHRLLALYHSDALPLTDLHPLLEAWEVSFPGLAVEGFQLAMRRGYPEDRAAAAELLPAWLLTLHRLDQIGPDAYRLIPEEWTAAPFAGLRRFLVDPAGAEVPDWWLETRDRRDALATAALDLARWRIGAGRAEEGEAILARARDVAPPQSPSWIDASAELALIYDQVPGLDPDGRAFDQIEMELFVGKGAAIGQRDYAAMLRFHRTLGAIYARRGEWGPTRGGRDAVYQLEHALTAAEALAGETGVHMPLPEVRRILGDAYLAGGRTTEARDAFTRAALAHLEVDDHSGAAAMLERAREAGGDRASDAAMEAVARWVELRSAGSGAGADPSEPCDARTLDVARNERPGPGLDGDHLVRQRFKLLADCAPRAGARAPELAAEALEEVLATGTALVGVSDLARVEDVRRIVFAGFGQSTGSVPIATRGEPRRPGTIPISLLSAGRTLYLQPGPDALLAARLVRELQPSRGTVRLQVRDGEVTVIDLGPRSPASLEEVRRLVGSDRLRVRGGGGR